MEAKKRTAQWYLKEANKGCIWTDDDPNLVFVGTSSEVETYARHKPWKHRSARTGELDLAEMENDSCDLGFKEWDVVMRCGLTERQLQCVWYRYFMKKTQQEVAELLGMSQPGVVKILSLGTKKIKNFCKKWL